jgi:hypothetical protein
MPPPQMYLLEPPQLSSGLKIPEGVAGVVLELDGLSEADAEDVELADLEDMTEDVPTLFVEVGDEVVRGRVADELVGIDDVDEELTEDVLMEDTETVFVEDTEDFVEDTEEILEDVVEEIFEDVVEEIFEEVAEEVLEEVTEEVLEKVADDVLVDVTDKLIEDETALRDGAYQLASGSPRQSPTRTAMRVSKNAV